MSMTKENAVEAALVWYDSGAEDREEFKALISRLFDEVWLDGWEDNGTNA